MEPQFIGVKQLHRDLPKIAERVRRGQSFIVMKHAKPILRIEPVRQTKKKKYTLADLMTIQLSGGDKNLSKHIDQVVYGI